TDDTYARMHADSNLRDVYTRMCARRRRWGGKTSRERPVYLHRRTEQKNAYSGSERETQTPPGTYRAPPATTIDVTGEKKPRGQTRFAPSLLPP
ncbi:hypothetical protein ALC56_14677, partial [Trachymyrmex septentrionalis]